MIGATLLAFLTGCGGSDDPAPTEPSVIRYSNALPPAGTDPLAGAANVYQRSTDGSRHSPFDVEISLFNAAGQNITPLQVSALQKAYNDIYLWKYTEWSQALATVPATRRTEILDTKANAFWETSAQHMAERVFGRGVSSPIYKFGPQCAVTPCANDAGLIADAHRIVVKTTVQGQRDPLNPVTRSITFTAQKDKLENPEAVLELVLPVNLQVASTQRENLDFRPTVAGSRTAYKDIRIVVAIDPMAKKRTTGFDYPDFNLVFLPMRHLVFQGEVSNPRGPDASLAYANEAALVARFQTVVQRLYSPTGAVAVANELKPFVSDKYYYMFGSGVAGYSDYILGAFGIAKGLKPDIATIDLVLDGRKAISVAQ